MHKGRAFTLSQIENDFVHLVFDLEGESVNKFDQKVIEELAEVLDLLENNDTIKGLLISSGKPVFVVGADISEFGPVFAKGPDEVKRFLKPNNDNFNRLEELNFPVVVAINGYALGGGLEIALACDYRIVSESAKVGLPEIKLGIIPGWGGTVRLPRVAGVDVAVEWIASGKDQKPAKALADGVVDGVVADENLMEAALDTLKRAADGDLDYRARRKQKTQALQHSDTEILLAFESSKAFVGAQAGRNYPAPVAAVQAMQMAARSERDAALDVESAAFGKLVMTDVAPALVGLFLSDQMLGSKAKKWAKKAKNNIERAAVLGAGIMGGGISYQSALKKTPVIMKDVAQAGLDLGMSEAAKLLTKRVEKGRMNPADMASTLNNITPTLSYEGFNDVDIVIEAVVENEKVKKIVLAEVEAQVGEDAIICSNTSSILISRLASALKRPENFCGMHFFNPVHAMPLVEVIRGEQTSDEAIAASVAYVNKLGKKAVVVGDCPGFLVNRVLFPYFAGFAYLVREGADFKQVDKVMEKWGWPMGPAYLLDVIGIDTGVHAESVLIDGFPDRLSRDFSAATDILFEAGHYGQKTGRGFYSYEKDKKGKPQKTEIEDTYNLLAPHSAERKEFSEEEIIARLMVPMATEMMLCLEEGIVESPGEADMALVYGLGFPPFRGGVFRWIDAIGIEKFAEMADANAELSPLYKLTDSMRKLVEDKHVFYPMS